MKEVRDWKTLQGFEFLDEGGLKTAPSASPSASRKATETTELWACPVLGDPQLGPPAIGALFTVPFLGGGFPY